MNQGRTWLSGTTKICCIVVALIANGDVRGVMVFSKKDLAEGVMYPGEKEIVHVKEVL